MTPTTEAAVNDSERRKATVEYGDRIRALIRHENDITNHRTTWLLVIQALLVTAASNFLKDFPEIVLGIVVIGILVAYSIGDSLTASLRSRVALKKMWSRRLEREGYALDDMLPVDGAFAPGEVRGWLLPGRFLPKLIMLAWAVLAVYVVARHWR